MRTAWLGLILAACDQDRDMSMEPARWNLRLDCDVGYDGIPACPGSADLMLQVEDHADDAILAPATHRSFFPGRADRDGSYGGVGGPAVAAYDGPEIVWTLRAWVDDPLTSARDLAAWETNRLELRGLPGTRCFEGEWSWLDEAGAAVAVGTFVGERRFRECL